MRAVTAIALMLIASLATAGQVEQVISVQHDSQRGVTCWIVNNTGISCLPDKQFGSLPQPQAGTTSNESEAARASLANSTKERTPMTASPLPQDERFQL